MRRLDRKDGLEQGKFCNVAAAVIGGAVVGAAVTADSSRHAANTEADAANRATDVQNANYQQTRSDLKPYMKGGMQAQTALNNDLGLGTPTDQSTYGSLVKPFTINDFYNNVDPGYKFQLDQGMHALQNSQAAKNGVLGGAALKDLIGFNQGMAGTAYNDAFNRYQTQNQNTFSRLSNVLGIGENAAAGSGTIGATVSGNMANTITGAGNAQAAGIMGQANAINSGLNNISSYYMMKNMGSGGDNWYNDVYAAGGT